MSEEKECYECGEKKEEFIEDVEFVDFEGEEYCPDCLEEISKECPDCEERKRNEDFSKCSRCGKMVCYECISDEYPWRSNEDYCQNCMSVFTDLVEKWERGEAINYDPKKNGEEFIEVKEEK